MDKDLPIRVNNIDKKFGDKHVLSDISLNVAKGSIFGLIGLNGVGKTTLIKIMLGLAKADKGDISFFGQSFLMPYSRNNLCYLPEKFFPSPFLKGKEFLKIALSFYDIEYDHGKALELANRLSLDSKVLDDKIKKYSKGMAQKLGLLSVFLAKRDLLILDEPMSGLDPSARIELKNLLLDYRNTGGTIFLSSHILSDIDEICNKINILDKGKIIFDGTPLACKEKYQNGNLESCFLKAISVI